MKKPLIGLVALWDAAQDSFWLFPPYVAGVEEAGGVAVILSQAADAGSIARLAETLDGLLVTGGQDIDPAVYGAEKKAACGALCPGRDRLEAAILPAMVAADKPVLGICRGHQALNAVFGGTLYQDLPTENPSAVRHRMDAPYDRAAHRVALPAGTPLRDLLGVAELPVNSCHHQAVRDLAPGFRAMAVAEDGVVEGIWRPESRFVWGVQWHPEFFRGKNEAQNRIFRAFVDACRG